MLVTELGHGAGVGQLPAFDDWQSAPALMLTRRSQALSNHPGQWAFPGGRVDPGETAVEAALRELDEEAGVRLDRGAVLGRLDDFVTRSGFRIRPIVVWGGALPHAEGNPAEVSSLHRIPVSEFMRDDAPVLEPADEPDRPILRMPVGDDWIAAPTAAVIYQFREVCVLGRSTRVAHYEQPEFARR